MTPTREQIEAEVFDCAEALSGAVNTIDGDYCAWHTAPAAQVIVERLRKLAAALAPQEAAPMPPIEVGDWVLEADQLDLAAVILDAEGAEAMTKDAPEWVVEIRKANGTVWRRP